MMTNIGKLPGHFINTVQRSVYLLYFMLCFTYMYLTPRLFKISTCFLEETAIKKFFHLTTISLFYLLNLLLDWFISFHYLVE